MKSSKSIAEMKHLILLSVLLSACGTIKHRQEEIAYRFFATPKTYEQTVMRYGLPDRERETQYTRICMWERSEGSTGVATAVGPVAFGATRQREWRLTVVFSKVSGNITDWRFISN